MFTSIAAPSIETRRGFLPSQDPLIRLPEAFDVWEKTALALPKLFVSDDLRGTVEDLPPFPVER